jgi:hypothetical protein
MGRLDGGEAGIAPPGGGIVGSTAPFVRNDGDRPRGVGDEGSAMSGVREDLRYNADEVGVGLPTGGRIACLMEMKPFRIRIGRLHSVTVFPCLQQIRGQPPLFVVLPEFAGAQDCFAVCHRSRLYITQSPSGWVSAPVLCEFAAWFCEWVDSYGAERGWQPERAVLFLGQAPTLAKADALRALAGHNGTVVVFPPHLTRVLQPADVPWVRRFKTFLTPKLHQLVRDPRLLAHTFAELKENMERAAEKHPAGVGIVCSIMEANQVATVGSGTGLGFVCCGLAPWDVNQPLKSHHLWEGPAHPPRVLPRLLD